MPGRSTPAAGRSWTPRPDGSRLGPVAATVPPPPEAGASVGAGQNVPTAGRTAAGGPRPGRRTLRPPRGATSCARSVRYRVPAERSRTHGKTPDGTGGGLLGAKARLPGLARAESTPWLRPVRGPGWFPPRRRSPLARSGGRSQPTARAFSGAFLLLEPSAETAAALLYWNSREMSMAVTSTIRPRMKKKPNSVMVI